MSRCLLTVFLVFIGCKGADVSVNNDLDNEQDQSASSSSTVSAEGGSSAAGGPNCVLRCRNEGNVVVVDEVCDGVETSTSEIAEALTPANCRFDLLDN